MEKLGPQLSHQIFGDIVWRYHNDEKALDALRPLLLKFRDDGDMQALRQGVEAMYAADPEKAKRKSHLFSTGDARRCTGGHESYRAAVLASLQKWWEAAQHAAGILEDTATTPSSWHERFLKEVVPKLPCFGPYWSKYVYGDVVEHLAAERADLKDFTMVGPGCAYWLRFMGLPLQRGKKEQQQGVEALRELRGVVNKVLESGLHAGLEKARAQARLQSLTAYDVQVQSCECKRGFKMPARVAAARDVLWEHGPKKPARARLVLRATARGWPRTAAAKKKARDEVEPPAKPDTGAGVLRWLESE